MNKTKPQLIRELEVERALDTVRRAAFEMRQPDDLRAVAKALFDSFETLGFGLYRCCIGLIDEDADVGRVLAAVEGEVRDATYQLSVFMDTVAQTPRDVLEDLKAGKIPTAELSGDDREHYWRGVGRVVGYSDETVEARIAESPDPMRTQWVPLSTNLNNIELSRETFLTEEELTIAQRFAQVFDFAYSRYLELEERDRRSRELAHEAAVQKVRAEATSMRESSDITRVMAALWEGVAVTDMPFDGVAMRIYDPATSVHQVYAMWAPDGPYPDAKLHVADLVDGVNLYRAVLPGDSPWLTVRDTSADTGVEELQFEEGIVTFDREYVGALKPVWGIGDAELEALVGRSYLRATFPTGGLGITGPEGYDYQDDQLELIRDLAQAVSIGYARYIDLLSVERRNRELQVEASLERVRARASGMQSTADIGTVVEELFEQFRVLEFANRRAALWILDRDTGRGEIWNTSYDGKVLVGDSFSLEIMRDHPFTDGVLRGLVEGDRDGEVQLTTEEYVDLLPFAMEKTGWRVEYTVEEAPGVISEAYPDGIFSYWAYFSRGFIQLPSPQPFTADQEQVVRRFADVFGFAHDRFLELKRLEDQNRELQVEAALERVRAHALGMQRSEELSDVASTMWAAFGHLGITIRRPSLQLLDLENQTASLWSTTLDGEALRGSPFPLTELESTTAPGAAENYASYKSGDRSPRAFSLDPDRTRELIEWVRDVADLTFPDYADGTTEYPAVHFQNFFFSNGWLALSMHDPLDEADIEIGQRIADVFSFAYERFLELKRLEAQNRELQVEAALERVRARAQGMQRSDELSEVAVALWESFHGLGIWIRRPALVLVDAEADTAVIWTTTSDGEPVYAPPKPCDTWRQAPDARVQDLQKQFDAKRQEHLLAEFDREAFGNIVEMLRTIFDLPLPDYDEEGFPDRTFWLTHYFNSGYLILNTGSTEPTDEDIAVARRFTEVFGFAYDRFLELKRLEDQNRELQVEAALEHVRSRALGMQSSVEIPEVVEALFTQIGELGLPLWRCGIVFFEGQGGNGTAWLTTTSGTFMERTDFSMEAWRADPFFNAIYVSWEAGQTRRERLDLEVLANAIRYAEEHLNITFPEYAGSDVPVEALYHVWARFNEGSLYIALTDPVSDDDAHMLERFAEVFGFAYSRMQELELAEEQARQSERRAAVDHIRAEIAAMQTVDDFERVTPLLWQTLTVLGVPFVRCGFTIHDRETRRIVMHLSDPQGNPIAGLTVSADKHPFLSDAWDSWLEGRPWIQAFTRDTFVELQLAIQTGLESLSGETYVNPDAIPDQLVAHTVPYSHGMLYVNSTTELPREDLAFVSDLAGAFSVAYARYQDFRQLEKQNEDLEEASRVKSRFLANMSHELRTPMNAIIGFTQIVLRRGSANLSERHRANLEKVKQSADHLLALINDVLDLSKIEANKMDLKPERFVVKDLISSSCATVSPLVKGSVKLSYEVDDDVTEAFQDAGRLRQVMINLLSNALKFTERGSVRVSVGRQSAESGAQSESTTEVLVISVADTGVGIPEEALEGIFQEFQQVDGSLTRKHQGTGLGLSICKMLTELMGGEISVESEVEVGSTFTVVIPREYKDGISDA